MKIRSSFVCKTSFSIEEVEWELKKMIDHLGIIMDKTYKYDEIFGNVVKTENPINHAESYYIDSDYEKEEFAEASIIIRSASDNAIPYFMHEIIEEKFDAFRIHRG